MTDRGILIDGTTTVPTGTQPDEPIPAGMTWAQAAQQLQQQQTTQRQTTQTSTQAAPSARLRPPDAIIQWAFNEGHAQGDVNYWLNLPASSPEWDGFINTIRQPLITEVFTNRGGQGDPNYWQGIPTGSTEWQSLFNAFTSGASGGMGGGGTSGGAVDVNLEGASLIRVTQPDGTKTFAVEYQAYGVLLRYEIGDQARLDEIGLSATDFDSFQTLTFSEFEDREGLDVGLFDERFGLTETPQESIQRQLRVFGKEDLPPWLSSSKEAMTVALQGSLEGWSDGRTLNELSRTTAFAQAFPDFDSFRAQRPDATITQTLSDYVEGRNQIRESIRTWRGPQAETSDQFIGQVLAQGWDPTQVETVLIGEARLRQLGPGAVDRLNEILAFQGQDPIGVEQLLDFILPGETERTPAELQELINDAIRSQSFANQGITLSGELASMLGPDLELGVLDPESAAQIARETATQIFRFGQELSAEREGLTRDDLIKAMVDGDQAAGVSLKLAKFARRRAIEGQGTTGRQGFLGERGNLRIAGFDSL